MIKKIKDVMTKNVITLTKSATVMDAVNIMADNHISCVVIRRGKKPVGIITERDMVRRVLQWGIDPKKTKVEKIMSYPVKTLNPNQNILDAIKTMKKYNIRRVAICTDKNKLVGIVTETDLFRETKRLEEELQKHNKQLMKEIEKLKKFNAQISGRKIPPSQFEKKLISFVKKLNKL